MDCKLLGIKDHVIYSPVQQMFLNIYQVLDVL